MQRNFSLWTWCTSSLLITFHSFRFSKNGSKYSSEKLNFLAVIRILFTSELTLVEKAVKIKMMCSFYIINTMCHNTYT